MNLTLVEWTMPGLYIPARLVCIPALPLTSCLTGTFYALFSIPQLRKCANVAYFIVEETMSKLSPLSFFLARYSIVVESHLK